MSFELESSIGTVRAAADETRRLAIAGVRRRLPAEDAGTVLAALGLAVELEPERPTGRQPCEHCGKLLPDPVTNGGHKPCQRRACRESRPRDGSRPEASAARFCDCGTRLRARGIDRCSYCRRTGRRADPIAPGSRTASATGGDL